MKRFHLVLFVALALVAGIGGGFIGNQISTPEPVHAQAAVKRAERDIRIALVDLVKATRQAKIYTARKRDFQDQVDARKARMKLAEEGKPAFVIVHHYGITGLLSFYMPHAAPGAAAQPLVYSIIERVPQNQFYFWPEYKYTDLRKGENAIFVVEMDLPQTPMQDWFKSLSTGIPPQPPPPAAVPYLGFPPGKFESFKSLGVFPVYYKGRVYRWLELFECRNLL